MAPRSSASAADDPTRPMSSIALRLLPNRHSPQAVSAPSAVLAYEFRWFAPDCRVLDLARRVQSTGHSCPAPGRAVLRARRAMKLTVRETAAYLNVSEKTIYRWIRSGELPAYRVHDQYRFNRVELLEWAAAKRINVSPDLFAEPESAGQPLPGLVDAFRAGGIHYRVGGETKEAILQAVVALLPLPEGIDREFMLRMLLAREALGSTALGQGVAIPHPRSPIVMPGIGPSVAACFLDHPVDFGALDGAPVHTLLVLLSPSIRAHLHLVSRIAWALRDPGVQAALAERSDRERLFGAIERVERSAPLGARSAASGT
ncbi:MAG: PTS sugar transporter subunit IIA [Myxococcales bacterium]